MDWSSQIIIPKKHIIFFDGVCNLCNGAVDFIIKRDDNYQFIFESLQSPIADQILGKSHSKSLEYIIVKTSAGELLSKSEAVFFISKRINGFTKLILIFSILPLSITDFFYSLIARYRYKLFGKRNTCRMPNPDDKFRFLEGYQNV